MAGVGAGGGARAQISGPLVLRWINRIPAVPWLLTLIVFHNGLWKGRALGLLRWWICASAGWSLVPGMPTLALRDSCALLPELFFFIGKSFTT